MSDKLAFPKNPTEHDIDITLREVIDQPQGDMPIRIHYTAYGTWRKQVIHHHWHQELELLYITEGKIKLTVEGHTFVAVAGDIVTIPSKYLHSGINPFDAPCALYALVFDYALIAGQSGDPIHKKYIKPVAEHPHAFFLHMSQEPALVAIVQQIIDKYGRQSLGYELFIRAQLYLFLSELYTLQQSGLHPLVSATAETARGRANNSYACRKTIAYIEKNIASPISLEAIASYVGFNREYFCRFFKRNFGLSFTKYLNQYRVQCAEHYLLNTDQKIIDISTELGFTDANYFAHVFKNHTGMTPTDYRQQQP